MTEDLLQSLNTLVGAAGDTDRFALRNGVVSGYVDTTWRKTPAILGVLGEAITRHLDAPRQAQRILFGIEIGTNSAKLYGTVRPGGTVLVDVKLQLTRLAQMADARREYAEQLDQMLRAFRHDGSFLAPANIDFADRSRIRIALAATGPEVTYVYGTQGPREAQRKGIALPPQLRVLTAREEGLLMFAGIVPPEHAGTLGTMAIEIGSGSTELILGGADGRKHTIAFAIAGDRQTGLDAIVRGIETNDIVAQAGRHLETDPASAAEFIAEARKLREAGGFLFMNPSRASAAFRRQSPRHPIDVAWAQDYGASSALDKFAAKAKILAALARAFGFAQIHEGRPGGLKRAMADFIGAALAET